MNLSFSEIINGTQQHFLIKIWLSLDPELRSADFQTYQSAYFKKFGDHFSKPETSTCAPKIHTIRRIRTTAEGNIAPRQWRAGTSIHFTIHPASPLYFRFAPVTRCIAVQQISIVWGNENNNPEVRIDGRRLNSSEIDILARNDGFDSTDSFSRYFDKDFTGTLVHWTPILY
ncbi:MAG: hypothetical protein EOO88_14835 [Pedobacter sp.]|nr:MAG: hypothetical protein EOO88_14835 [Pedobacter sp.]